MIAAVWLAGDGVVEIAIASKPAPTVLRDA
jgi:hypothetical protein